MRFHLVRLCFQRLTDLPPGRQGRRPPRHWTPPPRNRRPRGCLYSEFEWWLLRETTARPPFVQSSRRAPSQKTLRQTWTVRNEEPAGRGAATSVVDTRVSSPFESPLTEPDGSSVSSSVELLLEECDRASSAASACSMLSRLLEDGSCRYFSGT